MSDRAPIGHQGESFRVPSVRGRRVAQLLGLAFEEDDLRPEVVLLKLDGPRWHRLYLDTNLGFWEELDENDAFHLYEDARRVDYAGRFRLAGAKVQGAACQAEGDAAARIVIELSSGTFELGAVDPRDVDTDLVVSWRERVRDG